MKVQDFDIIITEKKLFNAVAFHSYDRESWRVYIGVYATASEAEKACYDYGKKKENDCTLQYFQVQDN